MKPIVPKPQRCAIYTRKSTEHNLDLEFNSLDAQREAGEAYIKSQAHEGWRLVPDRYDDGGLSGASLDRPALQNLLADVGAGTIFTRYLELGSIGALLAELDWRGIRTKVNGRRDGGRSGGICFGVGSLAHLLNNRFYIGEITYRGEVHHGEHEPILTRDLFEAVQAKRVANAVARHVRLRGSAAILTGRLFDDRGNRMSPTHANKRGVRYRYYVSHAILQNRKAEAGNIARVPAPEMRQRPQAPCSNGRSRSPDRACGPRAGPTPCRARDR